MGPIPRHPNKEINKVVDQALRSGWRIVRTNGHGHAGAHLLCPNAGRSGCRISVWSTPRNTHSHAKAIQRLIDKCRCQGGPDD